MSFLGALFGSFRGSIDPKAAVDDQIALHSSKSMIVLSLVAQIETIREAIYHLEDKGYEILGISSAAHSEGFYTYSHIVAKKCEKSAIKENRSDAQIIEHVNAQIAEQTQGQYASTVAIEVCSAGVEIAKVSQYLESLGYNVIGLSAKAQSHISIVMAKKK